METALLETKTRVPPSRKGWVARTRILEDLAQDTDPAVILVRAPAGYGKSTLLTQLAKDSADRPVAWVTLSQEDNDPVVFWRYVCSALRSAVPDFADAAWRDLAGANPDLDGRVLPALLNGLVQHQAPLLLVLDDYEAIDSDEIHEMMRLFLSHLPRSTQLAISTRSEPSLALARMRAYGILKEITAADLAFTPDETSKALRSLNGSTDEEIVREIQARTEGWPTGIYVAGRSEVLDPSRVLRFGSARATIDHFLASEMLGQLDDSAQSFVRGISILDECTGEICDYILGQDGSAERLRDLASSNLLLSPLDDAGISYRLHGLLRDALSAELAATEPARKRELHLRAHEWMLSNGRESEAIDHLIEAGELVTAASLVCAFSWPYQYTGRGKTVARWIERLPESLLVDYPPLSVSASWSAALQGDIREAQRLCKIATSQSFDGPSPDGTASYEAAVALLSVSLFPTGTEDALRQARTAYELEPADSPWKPTAAAILGSSLGAAGDYESGIGVLAEATTERSDPGIRTFALGQLACFEIWRTNWAIAAEAVELAIELIEEYGLADASTSALAFAAAAALASHNGKPDLARSRQMRAETASIQAFPGLVMQVAVVNGETSLSLGDADRAARYSAMATKALAEVGEGGQFSVRVESLLAETEGIEPEPNEVVAALTTRERQILSLLPSGLSIREIGHRLYISRNTAKTHIARIYRKLDCQSREDAVARASDMGLV